ncbi:MAG: hypothetical protein UY33_C0003G0010 [Candidatus Amesbacteria bacterium GW2011_GWA1_48_9]|uniref:Uncharacterized protein n=1 Tax=Candidatus Amesbacteria bacterium GW2011_GWA1_48_9 TaxID=1618355 RepID=A0A0G1XE80_9BACT|nr:MAG: hypothetical protein UY33_C0003G0010 [Candidatus Amesbacteria bacterium GW2011_GWA1_48_9]
MGRPFAASMVRRRRIVRAFLAGGGGCGILDDGLALGQG